MDEVSEQIGAWLAQAGTQKENMIRIRLAMEEILLRLCRHYDEKLAGALQEKKVPWVLIYLVLTVLLSALIGR